MCSRGFEVLCFAPSKLPRSGCKEVILGRPPAGSRGLNPLIFWPAVHAGGRLLTWLCCGAWTGGAQIGQAVRELTCVDAMRVFSKRRSLSFNHNSGLQPGPSNSCWLRPSSCGIPLTLLVVHFSYYLRSSNRSGYSHLTLDINKVFFSSTVYLHTSSVCGSPGPARPSLLDQNTLRKVPFLTINMKIKIFFIVCFVHVIVSTLFYWFYCCTLQFLSSYISACLCCLVQWLSQLQKLRWVPEGLN